MLYIVLLPAWVWITLLTTVWVTLTFLVFSKLGFRHPVMIGLMVVMMLQAIAASSVVIVTSQNPLSNFACLMGYFGMRVSLAIILAEVIVLIFLFTIWPQRQSEEQNLYWIWVSLWMTFNVVALLAHMRSTALCTV